MGSLLFDGLLAQKCVKYEKEVMLLKFRGDQPTL